MPVALKSRKRIKGNSSKTTKKTGCELDQTV